jgi:DNA polymerase III epsilon subunit-like protein
MKFIVYDTETTGLPQSKYVKPSLTELWPYIVQFSYIIYDSDTNCLEKKDYIVQIPSNIVMNEKNISIHGITNEMSQTKGVKINDVVEEFMNNIEGSYFVIGHNLEFDLNILKVELLRMIRETADEEIKQKYREYLNNLYSLDNYYCTMQNSIELCKLPNTNKKYGDQYKYPRLDELHNHLFGVKPQKLHNSLNDVFITFRCFYKLYLDQDICDVNNDMEKTIKSLM